MIIRRELGAVKQRINGHLIIAHLRNLYAAPALFWKQNFPSLIFIFHLICDLPPTAEVRLFYFVTAASDGSLLLNLIMASQFQMSSSQGTLANDVLEIKQSLNQLREHVRLQDKHIAQCLKNEKGTAALLLKLQRDHSDLVKYTGSLEEYCLELDAKSRKKHLVLTGVPETAAENKLSVDLIPSKGE